MKYKDLRDSPLFKPEEDLLGINRFPRELAALIGDCPGPMTVGIYGAWGSGKTSFVNLVKSYLKDINDKYNFISFSAWPYRSADELWRALILSIAQELFNVPPGEDSAEKSAANSRPRALVDRLSQFLADDALVFDESEPQPGPRDEYDRFVSRLDGTPYGTIAKDGGQRIQLDEQEATMAVVKAALAGLGSLSPLLAALRSLLGLGGEIDLAALVRHEKNEAVRDRIASVHEFKKVFEDLLKKAGDNGLCVCVDDLDRCMPDVALDLLEAIKIFLDQSKCVFLLAADQELINRGLRLRYREIARGEPLDAPEWDLERKGQEYFEKIIQLHIPVPTPTESQLHEFIALKFPLWAPASDLILIDTGYNPRRITQRCNWLTYKQRAFDIPEEE